MLHIEPTTGNPKRLEDAFGSVMYAGYCPKRADDMQGMIMFDRIRVQL